MMKYMLRIVIAVFVGALLMTTIAWTKGNENFFTHKYREDVNPLKVKNPELDRKYFNEIVVVETITPSSIPLIFESKYDTISKGMMSVYKR